MKKSAKVLVAMVALFVAVAASSLRAELPPGTYTMLKTQASEVFVLRVKRVKKIANGNESTDEFLCGAEIVSVGRSKSEYQRGETIRFRFYRATNQALRNGFAGPANPPLLRTGWYGRVYLNSGRDKDVLELATYGKSFEAFRSRRR